MRRDLKTGRESEFLMSGGSEFQRRGAERLKALDPMVDSLNGGALKEMDLRDR